MKLYDIAEEFRAWEARLDEAGGELDPEREAELDRITAALGTKVDALAALIREGERSAEACRSESRRVADRARHWEHRTDRLRGYLVHHLKRLGLDRVDGPRFRVSVDRNAIPSISWPPERGAIPGPFQVVDVDLNGRACQEAHRDGRLPDGFEVSYGEHLMIR